MTEKEWSNTKLLRRLAEILPDDDIDSALLITKSAQKETARINIFFVRCGEQEAMTLLVQAVESLFEGVLAAKSGVDAWH